MSLFAKKMNVVLDTNALLLFGQGIDVFTEVERLFEDRPAVAFLSETGGTPAGSMTPAAEP